VNCVELFKTRAKENRDRMAIRLARRPGVSFGELLSLGARAQKVYRQHGLKAGDTVLLADNLGPRLYASVIGILASGATAVLVEPWMPIERINRVIRQVQPKIFSASFIGRMWGLRSQAVREIPHWVRPNEIVRAGGVEELELESVDPETIGILTFTSGTTGEPKGVVRHQGYLMEQHRVLSNVLDLERHVGPDLCIFANFALANLASGRGSIIVPPSWKQDDLRWLEYLPVSEAPESLTTGPAFLMRLMDESRLPALKSLHVGGALTDCWIFETAFAHFPDAHVAHIYGSSEAEPVACSDAREAVERSRARGYFQTLSLGKPVHEITSTVEKDNVWVTGPHVCPLYIGGEEENRLHKRKDEQGRVWHSMGDRVREDFDGWWYSGRSGQALEDFELEQKVYAAIGSSKAFVIRENDALTLCIEPDGLRRDRTYEILRSMKLFNRISEVKIKRDRRHRARIDRAASLRTRKPWRIG
jgi:olefin beta-lactone synthetase